MSVVINGDGGKERKDLAQNGPIIEDVDPQARFKVLPDNRDGGT